MRSDEEVELEAMSVEQLRSLIVRERREREAARSPIVIASTVTQGEPGPLTVSGQTGVFSPSGTQEKTIAAIPPITERGPGDDQGPTSGTTSKAGLAVRLGVGGSDTALPGGVFQAGVSTAPVFVPATGVEARSAADTGGVLRATGPNMVDGGPGRWEVEMHIPSGQGSRPPALTGERRAPAPSFLGDPPDQRFTRNNNNDYSVQYLPGEIDGVYSPRAEMPRNRERLERYGNPVPDHRDRTRLRLVANDGSSATSPEMSPRRGATGCPSPNRDQEDSGLPDGEWRLSQKHETTARPEPSVHDRRLTGATRQLQAEAERRLRQGHSAAAPAATEVDTPVYNGKFVRVGARLASQGNDVIYVSHIADNRKSYVVGVRRGDDREADDMLIVIGSKPLDLRIPLERLKRVDKGPFTGDGKPANNFLECMELFHYILLMQERFGFDPDGAQQMLLVNLGGTAREMVLRTPILFDSLLYLVNRYLGDTERAKAMALVSELKQRNGESVQEFAIRLELLAGSVQLQEQRAKWILTNAISEQWKRDNPNLVVYLCNWEANPKLSFLDWKNDLKRVLREEVVSRREVVRHDQADRDGSRRQRREQSGGRNAEGRFGGPPRLRIPPVQEQGGNGVGHVAQGVGRGAGRGADRGVGRGAGRGAYPSPQQPIPAGRGAAGRQPATPNSNNNNSGVVPQRCRNCGGPHGVDRCRYTGPVCYSCQSPGHNSRECPARINRVLGAAVSNSEERTQPHRQVYFKFVVQPNAAGGPTVLTGQLDSGSPVHITSLRTARRTHAKLY